MLTAWGAFRSLRFFVALAPCWFLYKWFHEEIPLSKYPTAYGQFPHANRSAHYAAKLECFPSDKTFTTRLRNVEWGHDYINILEWTPRMNPKAETFPDGTRMNWVTFQVK
jgi:hypothetical protein